MMTVKPVASNQTFDINGAHITLIDQDGRRRVLRTVGPNVSSDMEDLWYDPAHRAVMDAVYALENALKELAK